MRIWRGSSPWSFGVSPLAPPTELHMNKCADGFMLPFASAAEMLRAHQLMFGAAGQLCAEIVLDWAPRLFAAPIDPLTVRVVLAPVELETIRNFVCRRA